MSTTEDDWSFWMPEPEEVIEVPKPAPALARPAARLTAGSRRVSSSSGDRDYRYIGVVRLDGKTLVECGHEHRNRDWSGAVACARSIIDGARRPATATHVAGTFRTSWEGLTRGFFTVPQSTIDQAKAEASASADAYLAAVEIVKEAL
uniref:hypothetical protein n=1 Tax=Paractinoplanes polyasparticus TaxID=2856853 RepID=UPI001C857466|nr:hypothetical protein [Actinoplanes polyasparticus]